MKAIPVIIFLYFILFSNNVCAKHLYPEKTYQNQWCKNNNGITEFTLDDKTRIDCLTQDYAIEFDFANKWAEAVGQALYYGLKTNKQPAIVLILETPSKENKYVNRLKIIANYYNIKIWTTSPESLGIVRHCENQQ